MRTLKYDDYITINNTIYTINGDYTSLNPALFCIILDECLPDNITVNLDYCSRIYLESAEEMIINNLSYNVSLLLEIKLHQLPIGSYQLEINNENEEEEILTIYIIKIPQHGDYNSTPVFYLRSNLGSNFYVQAVDEEGKDIILNQNIFMRITITFLPNLPITYTGNDYKNDCYTSALSSGGYLELVDSNLHPVDLLYPLRLNLLIEFY
jgi:hypothetical protein